MTAAAMLDAALDAPAPWEDVTRIPCEGGRLSFHHFAATTGRLVAAARAAGVPVAQLRWSFYVVADDWRTWPVLRITAWWRK